jgi:hypothetical protein
MAVLDNCVCPITKLSTLSVMVSRLLRALLACCCKTASLACLEALCKASRGRLRIEFAISSGVHTKVELTVAKRLLNDEGSRGPLSKKRQDGVECSPL